MPDILVRSVDEATVAQRILEQAGGADGQLVDARAGTAAEPHVAWLGDPKVLDR